MLRSCLIIVFSCFIFGCDSRQSSSETNELDEIEENIVIALAPVEIPTFFSNSPGQLVDIQSPFTSRKQTHKEIFSLKFFIEQDWKLVGEVKKDNALLGVFLRSKKGSRYFGVGQPMENNQWRIVDITRKAVVLEDVQRHVRWTLFYDSQAI